MGNSNLQKRYGPWAIVIGATEGIGEAFSRELASSGLNVFMVARTAEPLDQLAPKLHQEFDIETKTLALDIGDNSAIAQLAVALAGLDVGILVYNAASSYVGPFLEQTTDQKNQILAVNISGLLAVVDYFAQRFTERGQGGIVLMSSMASLQGAPLVATYAATKAFIRVLAESLWDELRPMGIDVLACVAGATDTPRYRSTEPKGYVPIQKPSQVAEEALDALGKQPVVITGLTNRLAAFIFGRLVPRSWAIRFMGRQTRRLYG